MKQKILAVLMIIAVLLCFMPTMAFADQTPATEIEPDAKTLVQEKANDLSITKGVVTNSDGSYDLVLEAFATGTSQVTTVSKPLDIVLVLDVSGSMDDNTTTRTYTAQASKGYSYHDIESARTQYYYKDSNDQYYPVYAGYKWHLFDSDEYYLYYRIGYRDYRIGTVTDRNQPIYTGVLYTADTKTAKKLDSMKAAAKNFVNTVAADAAANNVDHKIAVVKFAGKKSDRSGNDTYQEGRYTYNYSQIVVDLTEAKTGAATLKGKIDALKAAGATQANFGMELAKGLLTTTSADRQKVVVLFTDGEPTTYQNFENAVANGAISAAKTMKDAGTVIYTVGMIANPSNNVENFLNYTSSNYPDAVSMENPGNKADGSNYSIIVTDGSNLDDVFQRIASEAVSSAASADETSLLKDTLSPYFNFKLNADNKLDNCKVEKVPCTGENTWGTPEDITKQVNVEFNGKDIQVSGFDYIDDNNLVVQKTDGSWRGHKLVLTFSIVPDRTAVWQTGTHDYSTNDTDESKAGLYASDDSGMLTLPKSPMLPLTAYAVTYTDGVDDEDVFADEIHNNLKDGDTTPAFTGTLTRNGYEFAGWTPAVAETVTASATYVAKWTPKSPQPPVGDTYTVTYTDGVDGEKVFADQVYSGLQAGTATPAFNGTPTREGFDFSGWSPNVAETVTASATYVAKWTPKSPQPPVGDTYTVTYTDGVEGEEVFADQVYSDLASGTATPAFNGTPTRDGYKFTGWNPAVAETVTGNATYTAQWEKEETPPAETYTVTYTDGVEGEEVFADQVYSDLASGTATPAFNGTPTRDGYKFTGWNPAVAETVTGNATYTAQWEKVIIPPTPTPSVYPLTITKQIVGLDTVPAGYAVTVTITNKYGTVVRTVTLKANETKTIYLSYGEYTLTETAPAVEGYTQSGQTFSENNFVLNSSVGKNVTVTNTYTKDAEKPPVDPKPTDPKPTDPATPVKPNKPDENPNKVPKTGDDMPISLAIYGIIAVGALLGIRKAVKRETK